MENKRVDLALAKNKGFLDSLNNDANMDFYINPYEEDTKEYYAYLEGWMQWFKVKNPCVECGG